MMNFLKNFRSKITPKSEKKSVRVLEEGLNDEEKSDVSTEDSYQVEENQMDTLTYIQRGYTTDSEDPKDVKILHSAVRIHWTNILVNIISLHNHYIWKFMLLGSIYTYFILKIFQIGFIRTYGHPVTWSVAMFSNLLFFLNYVCLVTIFFWKKLHLLFERKGKFKLILDGLLVPPFGTLFQVFSRDYSVSAGHTWLSINSLIRLYYLEEFFREKSNSAGVNHWNYFVTEYILRLFLLTHSLACLLFLLACPIGCESPTGWGYVVMRDEVRPDWYLQSSVLAFMNLSNSGQSDLLATDFIERILIIITMCCGFVLTTLILIGALSLDMVNKLFRLANMRSQLYAIRKHLKSIRMSRKDTDLILNYYRLFWKKKKGVKDASAINLLPLPLQMEISFDINYYLLQCSMLFRNKPEPFLRTLSLNMKHEFFQTGENIFKCNAIKQKMICVASGIIEVTSDEDYESPIISFGRGSVLGEAALILSLPSKTTVKAANYCELQVLYKVDFIRIIHLYPEIFLQLRETILSRIGKFRLDEDRIQLSSKFLTLNLYVSQKKNLSAIKRLKKRLLREPFYDIIPKSHHACDLYQFVANVKKKKGRYVFLTEHFPWIFSPRSKFMEIWQIIIFLDVICVGFTYPYFIAYHRKFPPEFEMLSNLMELLYYADMYIMLMTAVECKDYIKKKLPEILMVNLRTFWFYVEILSSLPFEIIFFNVSEQIQTTIKVNRLLKCFRICTFFGKLESKVLTHNIIGIRLVKYVTYIVLVNYWFGILLYSTTCFTPSCFPDGWYRYHVDLDRKLKLWQPCSAHPTLMATYFGLTVMSTIGFGDIIPGNNIDRLIMMLGTLLGIFLFGYCTAELSATISYYIKMKINFQADMFGVEKFMIDNKMTTEIIRRVMKFFELQWYYNKGVSLWKTPLMHNAPLKIQKLVTFKEKREFIARSPIFQYVADQFVDYIARGSSIIVLPPDETVTYAGKYSRYLYIILEGFCRKEYAPGCFVTLVPGDYIGVRNAILGGPILNIVTTITHVKFLMLGDQLYFAVTALFPEENAIIGKCIPEDNQHVVEKLLADWKEHEQFLKHAKPVEKEKKRRCREWLSRAFTESFVWVPHYCERNGEMYNRPFEDLGYFHRVKYVLLPICILPQGWFLKIWVGIRFSAAILIALLVPYQQIEAPYFTTFNDILIILDVVAYIDLYLMLLVGYYGDKNQLIIHPCKTAKNYVKGTFILDVIFCLPFEYLVLWYTTEQIEAHNDKHHETHWLHYRIRLIKTLQAYRLPSFSSFLEKNIRITGLHIQILKFLPFTLICLNAFAAAVVFISCRYYHISDIKPQYIDGEEAKIPDMGIKKFQKYTMFCGKDSWIDRSKFRDYYSPSAIYMVGFYFSTSTLVGTGFGDVSAQQYETLIVIIFVMIWGTFFFGYVFAYTASYTSDLQSKFSIFQGILAELHRYFQMEVISKKIRELCLNNASYRWSRSGGIEANQILSIVHPALHGDAVEQLYQHTLEGISFFEGVDPNFLRIVGMALRERYYIRGTNIFREDEVIDSIFIVHRGQVEIKFYHNFHEEMVTRVGIGGIFGNIGNTTKSRMVSNAIALTNTDVLHLKTEVFHRILNNHPTIKEKVERQLGGQQHRDFSMPLKISEEKSDSIPGLPSESSDEEAESVIGIPSSDSIANQKSRKTPYGDRAKTDYPAVIENELKVLLFIFSPNKWFKMAILPESKILYTFVILRVIGGYIDIILVTYQFAFQDFHLWILFALASIDLIYIWNIFFELHTAYMNRYSDYVTDCRKIKIRYFSKRKRMIIGLLTNIPFTYVVFVFPFFFKVDALTIFSLLKLLSCLRIYAIRDFFNSIITNITVDRLLLNLLSTCIWLTLAIHIFSCLWYLFACPVLFCYEDSWVKTFYERPRSQFEVYIICIYFITGVFTNTGIGDIVPKRYEEILLLILLMLMTKFLVGIFIGISTNIVSLHSSFLTRYEAGIYELRDYLMNENVSRHQMDKMWNYVKRLWATRKGRQMPSLIVEHMSYTNQCAVKYDVYGEDLRKSYLFHDLQESFLRQLSNFINPVVFFPGNYIVQHGDSDQSMYLVHRGEVDVLTVHTNLTETIHDVLHKGEMFGLAQGLFYGIPHHFSYRAKTTVDIGIIQLKEWEDLVQHFPGAKDFIYKRALAIYTIL